MGITGTRCSPRPGPPISTSTPRTGETDGTEVVRTCPRSPTCWKMDRQRYYRHQEVGVATRHRALCLRMAGVLCQRDIECLCCVTSNRQPTAVMGAPQVTALYLSTHFCPTDRVLRPSSPCPTTTRRLPLALRRARPIQRDLEGTGFNPRR